MGNPFNGFEVCFDLIGADEINDAEYDSGGKRVK